MSSIQLRLEQLEDRCTPSGIAFDSPPAFHGLGVAVTRFYPTDPSVPPNPIQVAPVFALNYGGSVDVVVPGGLNVALNHYPTDPTVAASPVIYGLANALPPGDELPI
jgi:hypothetical protein